MALPSGYTQVEYIESTGTQYIDTGFKPNQDTRIICELSGAPRTKEQHLFGSRSSTSSSDRFLFIASGDSVYRTDFYDNTVNVSTSFDFSGKFTIDKNKNQTFLNGELAATNANGTFSCRYNVFLLAGNTAGTPNISMSGTRLHSCKIYDNGTLVRDYTPVQHLDGAVGLLDKVNNVFYPDAAGGNFIAGPLAAKPEAPASLELIGTTRNAVVLAWPGSPVGQSYRLYRDGIVVYEGSSLCYTDAGLAAGSAHIYSVHTVIGSTESEGVTAEATTTEGIVLITDRTAADVSARRRKGYYNALDLIRVGEAMAYLEERFAAVGISVTVSPKLDWQLADIPTHAQALRYLTDIGVLRGKLTQFRETVILPGSLTALTRASANDIETTLLDVENLIHTIILSYRHYSGRTISGVNALP